MQDQLVEDLVYQHLEYHLLEVLVNQMLEVLLVSAPLSPVYMQDFPSGHLETAFSSHHPAVDPLMEPEALALLLPVELDNPVLARDK